MKEKFLKDLEKKLSVLSDDEIKDIVNEYNDIIDEKIKHGKTEEEAIKEFGDVKELSKEILKAYKINPDYNKSEFSEKTNDFIKSGEDLIKKGAQKLSDVTEEVVDSFKDNGKEFDSTAVFEIVIKVLLVLVALAVLRIPFYVIGQIGEGIFDIGVFPLNGAFSILWKILVWIVYVVVCVLLVMYVVNRYVKNENVSCAKKVSSKNETTKSTAKKKEETAETKAETRNEHPKKVVKEDTFGNFLMMLIKIWCVILFLVPLWCAEIGLITAMCVIIYLIIKGIEIYGVLLLLIGITGMFGFFSDMIWKLLFNKGKIHIFPVFFNIVFIVIGGLLTFDYAANLQYIDDVPSRYKEINSTYMVTIDEKTNIDDIVDKYIDNTLQDNQLKFEIIYHKDVYEVEEPKVIELSGDDRIRTIKHFKSHEFNLSNKYFKDAIDDLKHNKVYNYSLVDDITIKVYSNEKTAELYE